MKKIITTFLILLITFNSFGMKNIAYSEWSNDDLKRLVDEFYHSSDDIKRLTVSSINIRNIIDKKFPKSRILFQNLKNVAKKVKIGHSSIVFYDDVADKLLLKEATYSYIAQKIVIYSNNNMTNFEQEEINDILSGVIRDEPLGFYRLATSHCSFKEDWEDKYTDYSTIYWSNDDYALVQVATLHCMTSGDSSLRIIDRMKGEINWFVHPDYTLFTFSKINSDSVELNAYNGWSYGLSGIVQKGRMDILKEGCEECEIEYDKKIEIKFEDFKDYIIKY